MFHRPVASVVQDSTLINRSTLAGHHVFVHVDYEARVDGFEKTTTGSRARQQIGDHVAVGATYVKDEPATGTYELKGVDAEVRLGENSRIVAEYAESEGTGGTTFISDDGGVTYTPIPVSAAQTGSAWKAAIDLDIGEWFGSPDRYRLRSYVKEIDPGFSSNGNTFEQGTKKTGVNADVKIAEHDSFHLRYAREDRAGTSGPGVLDKNIITSAEWNHSTPKWGFGMELRNDESTDGIGVTLIDTDIGAASFWSKLSKKLTARFEHQETFSGPENDQSLIGLDYQVHPTVAVGVKGTHGTLGDSAQAGVVLTNGESEIYLTQRLSANGLGETSTTILGARSPLGPSSKVYTEYQWEDARGGNRVISLLGFQRQWEIKPGMRFLLQGETSEIASSLVNTKRSAGMASFSYAREGMKILTQNQLRRFDDTTRQEQVGTFNQFEYSLNRDTQILVKYSYSKTYDRDTDQTEAKYEVRSFGFAYRPVDNDRFNALARYTKIFDHRPPTQVGTAADVRVMDVFSLDTIFEITPRYEWISKLAARKHEDQVGALPAVETETYLLIQRLNMELRKPIYFGIEYRILDGRQTDDRQQGWLTEIMFSRNKYLRFGGGYNFTDFSDNEFSQNDYSVSGWFVRIQGRY